MTSSKKIHLLSISNSIEVYLLSTAYYANKLTQNNPVISNLEQYVYFWNFFHI